MAWQFCPICGHKEWARASPLENIKIWLHTPVGKEAGCWNLSDLEDIYGLVEGKDVIYSNMCDSRSHFSPGQMPSLYQSWDALLFLSGGEGFGVPVIEALASGLPVVYTDYSSHAGIMKDANSGIAVPCFLQPEPGNSILRAVPDIYAAADAIKRLTVADSSNTLRGAARMVASQYSIPTVSKLWQSILLEDRSVH